MVDNEKLREAQLLECELLKKFKEICERENIQYYLLGGTAIGAVRHQGFIPWDDDIDVALFRNDYDKFISLAKKYLDQGIVIQHFSLDPDYQDYTMKLANAKVSFLTQQERVVEKKNIWIDIFPLDGAPQNSIIKWFHFRRLDFLRMQLAFHYIKNVRIDENRAMWKKVLVRVARRVPIGKVINPSKVKKKIDREFRKYPVEKSDYIGNYMGAYHEREFFPKSYFAEGLEVEFENEKYQAPKELDKYLTHQYGDYMKMPPIEKQAPKHNIIDVVKEE